MVGIYKIISPSGKIYIGQSRNLIKRLRDYKLKNKAIKQPKLYRSFKKYGIENHIFEIIEECSVELLNERERYWQDYYDVLGSNGLNCVLTETGELPYIFTDEVMMKLSECKKGKLNPMFGIEPWNKGKKLPHLTGKNSSRFGKVHSEEVIKKMSESKIGKYTGENSPVCRIILNIKTGIYYFGYREASESSNINIGTLKDNLLGKTKVNRTPFILV